DYYCYSTDIIDSHGLF
nr:immunoglobulin light chain junction region [Macaca mulatta]MOX43278.1 immunoglobulin light chain junction region [Macaca mulatta]MOX43460.1 immunoglobulin light chain junction region [Macaca mulatta]MOX44767.1 immunoglobulin light chain junction region [Macaca mulatta]